MAQQEQILDQAARTRILTDMDHNFFVEASAGSGKTTSLVGRMVAMVESGFNRPDGIKIEEITAITFTKAAANEFMARFQAALDAKRRQAADPGLRHCYEQALGRLNHCFMGTIDAFCNRLIAEHPIEAGVPVSTEIRDEEDLALDYGEEWLAMLQGQYGPELVELYQAMLGWNIPTDELRDRMVPFFLQTRYIERVYPPYNPQALLASLKAARGPVQALLDIIEQNNLVKPGKGNQEIWDRIQEKRWALGDDWTKYPGDVFDGLQAISDGKSLRLVGDPAAYASPSAGASGSAAAADWPGFITAAKNGKEYLFSADAVVQAMTAQRYALVMAFMDRFAQMAAERLKRQGKLGFTDYLICLRDLLANDARQGGRLIRYISQRHKYYLVDEFQDTNPLQAQILFYLTAENLSPAHPIDDWRNCRPRPGSLFMVGDPKQSIYRFNQADIVSYNEVRRLFTQAGGEVLTLYQNYRSRPVLRKWFDHVFTGLMPDETDAQPKYRNIADRQDPARDPARATDWQSVREGVYKLPVALGSDGTKADNVARRDAEQVADLVLALCGQGGSGGQGARGSHGGAIGRRAPLIIDRDSHEARAIRFEDIMVITRSKSRMNSYMDAMAARNIPFTITGKTQFDQCELLQSLVRLVRAIASPQDQLAVVAALKSGVYAVTDQALYQHRQAGGRFTLNGADGDTGPVAEAIAELAELRRFALAHGIVAAVQHVIERCELVPIHLCAGDGRADYLFYAIELLRDAQTRGKVITLADAADYLEDLLENKYEREMILSRNQDAVSIINLHKAKGLQAPVVILADPMVWETDPTYGVSRTGGMAQIRMFSINTGKFGNKVIARTDEYARLMAQEIDYQEAEGDRLLYVAATRAENLLFVSSLDMENHARNTWRKLARDVVDENPIPLTDLAAQAVNVSPVVRRPEITASVAEARARLAAATEPSYQALTPSSLAVHRAIGSMATAGTTPYNPKGEDAGAIGTMVHRLMEILVREARSRRTVGAGGGVTDAVASADVGTRSIVSMSPSALDGLTRQLVAASGCASENVLRYLAMLRQIADTILAGGYAQDGPYAVWLGPDGTWQGTAAGRIPQELLAEVCAADQVYCEFPFNLAIGSDDPLYGAIRALAGERLDSAAAASASVAAADSAVASTPVSVSAESANPLLLSGIMDLVYRKNNQWHVIDYKTNWETANLAAEYHGQMALYQMVLNRLTGSVPAVGIYHIDAGAALPDA